MTVFCCSYKEASDDGTDSDDVLEWTTDVKQEEEKSDAETIEKVLFSRMGRKEGMSCFVACELGRFLGC